MLLEMYFQAVQKTSNSHQILTIQNQFTVIPIFILMLPLDWEMDSFILKTGKIIFIPDQI